MAKDVVCGMNVEDEQARSRGLVSDAQGRSYYFCSESCKRRFDGEPSKYAAQASEPKASDGRTAERYSG